MKCAVMTVGGWFDAEDLYGPLQIYREAEKFNPGIFNISLWAPGPMEDGTKKGDSLGYVKFGSETSQVLPGKHRVSVLPTHLKDMGPIDLPEAFVSRPAGTGGGGFTNGRRKRRKSARSLLDAGE